MAAAKVISLRVRPLQAAHLCFEVDGILAQANTHLGASVKAFDFAGFYATLNSAPTVAGDSSRLLYDFQEIESHVKPFMLAALRAEPRKTALNNAINARQNSYYGKYGHTSAIIHLMNQLYANGPAGTKPGRLDRLGQIAQDQWLALKNAYEDDGRDGVVKYTYSFLGSTTESGGSSTQTGQTEQDSMAGAVAPPAALPDLRAGGESTHWTWPGGDPAIDMSVGQSTSGESGQSSGWAVQRQTISNLDYAYRAPLYEAHAQMERAQISLMDQQFAQFMSTLNLPHLDQVFKNELQSIDGDVFRLQIAYLNTILMSPIAGIVTGIYKNPGDAVRAGEPVIRVENSATILLVASLVYRRRISIGSTLTVTTKLFDSPGSPTTVAGKVVAVRGQSADDHWEVIAQCDNLKGGKPIFPLGYHFDYDDTTVSIT